LQSIARKGILQMTFRPAAPESETPETDAHLSHLNLPDGNKVGIPIETVALLKSLERRLSLAQAEIKGYMRVVDELRRDLQLAIAHDRQPYPTAAAYETLCESHRKAKARIAELEKLLREIMACPRSDPNRGKGRWFSVMAKTALIERINDALKSRA
jgi:hypothetical protein